MRNITIILISLIPIIFFGAGCASLPAIQEIDKRDAPKVQKIIENIAKKYRNTEYYISFGTINNTKYAFAFKKPNRVFVRVGCCLLIVSNEKELVTYDLKKRTYVHTVPPLPLNADRASGTLGNIIMELLFAYSFTPGSSSYIQTPSDVSMLLSDGFEKISGGAVFPMRLFQFIHTRNALLDGWVDQFNIELLGESVFDGHDCYVLQMFLHWKETTMPTPRGTGFTETYRFWVDKESFLIWIVDTKFTRPDSTEMHHFITLNPEDVPNNVLLRGQLSPILIPESIVFTPEFLFRTYFEIYDFEVIAGSRLDDLFYPNIPASWKQEH